MARTPPLRAGPALQLGRAWAAIRERWPDATVSIVGGKRSPRNFEWTVWIHVPFKRVARAVGHTVSEAARAALDDADRIDKH